MDKDFLNELGELALGSRLKRLSDRMMNDALSVYEELNHDVRPMWFTLLALLSSKKEIGIVEASDYLGLSQPAISQFARDLIKKGYVIKKTDKSDSRKSNLTLTKKGKRIIEDMQEMWTAVDLTAKEICDEVAPDFFESIIKLENTLKRKSLKARVMEKL
jgi:DNA-binding MarR family transcriptional regulator